MSNERQKLPDLRQYQKGEKSLQKKIRMAGIAQLHLDEKLRDLDDIEGRVNEIVEQWVDTEISAGEKANIRSELVVLLKDQKELLKRGSESYNNLIRALNTLDFTHKRLVETSNQYRDFIDEHLLWIPSTEPASSTTLKNLAVTLSWITAPDNWSRTGRIFLHEISSTPWLTGLVVLLISGLLAISSSLHAAVNRVAERLQSPYSDRFLFTLQALALTLLIATPLPLLFAFSGTILGLAEEHFDFAKSVSSGLIRIAVPLFLLHVFLNLCKPQGIAAQHLHWDANTVAVLHRNIFWLMLLVIPLLFVSTLTRTSTESIYYSSLGRLCLLIIAIAQSVFAYFVLNPVRGVPKNILESNPRGWLMTLRHIWYPSMVLWPLAVAAVALIGYQYTAAEFMELFMETFWLVLGMLILHDIIVRWLTVSNLKLALLMARELREAEKTKTAGEGIPEAADTPKVEFTELSEQTRALVRILFWIGTGIGVFVIWSDAFPAFTVLENITLWQTQFLVGDARVLHAVTLADLAKAILLGIIVIAAAKNLPGVMELVVLRHMRLEPGSRYATMTITRYLIILVGFLVIFNTMGGRWSEIQWLVAALGVGLGFGLQEIVANFISGIILLFERPIRIGDTVTVGEVTGVVTRIQIRATTIRDMDRKELLVPNKMFITDQLINWSLSDPINRVVIPVGVAYGSDTKLAHQLMLDTIKSLPMILQEPEPSVYFVGFGDSSLDFEVRVFVKSYEDRFASVHAIHMELEKALREHDIEIPFPQRVVHMRNRED
jgi:potassium efflux system protein